MKRVLLGAALMAVALSTHAAGQAPAIPTLGSYADMCKQATNLPAEYGGESDLKGNPKLAAYCSCFSDKFTAHLLKINPAAPAPSAEQNTKDQFVMRASCRKQVGLPPPPPIK